MYLKKFIFVFLFNVLFNSKEVPQSLAWSFGCKTPSWYCDNDTLVSEDVLNCNDYDCPGFTYCAREKWCTYAPDATESINIQEIDLVIIENSKYLPRCLIMNLPKLKTIYGMNKNIADVEPWAFWNLPELQTINLSYNFIRTLQYGTFSELSNVESLDLSWNEIIFIDRGSFQGMRKLKKLDLSRNYIRQFDVKYCFFIKSSVAGWRASSMPLEELNVSHNRLIQVHNLNYFPHLKAVDLSHNTIVYLDFSNNFRPSQWLTKLDMNDNFMLQFFVTLPDMYIENFRMAFNRVKHIGDFNISARINFLVMDGNPWECKVYNEILRKISKKKITILNPNEDEDIYFATKSERENYPICWASEDRIKYFEHEQNAYKQKRNLNCETMSDCPGDMICKSGRCWNPCKQNVCDKSAICVSHYNGFFCKCHEGKVLKPHIEYTKCYNLDCFTNNDCLRYGLNYVCDKYVCKKGE